jgi:hypothetical protein
MRVTRGVAAYLLLLFVVTFVASAHAFRKPRRAEFHAIAAAVAKNPDGSYYCAKRRSTWVSTVRPRWALAQMRSNCGLGSQTVRFFLKQRTGRRAGWRLVERHYERLGAGAGVPCGSQRTPPDIRCGPASRNRMGTPWNQSGAGRRNSQQTASIADDGSRKPVAVGCIVDPAAPRLVLQVRPHGCSFHRRGRDLGRANLTTIFRIRQWRGWGARRARAWGRESVNMAGIQKVHLTLFRLSPTCNGHRVYKRMRVVYPALSIRATVLLDSCPGSR